MALAKNGLALAAADDQRALLARADERLGLVERHRDERVVALELGVGGAHGLGQRAGRQVVADEVRDDLGVGLARELERPCRPGASLQRRGSSRRCR